MSNHSDISPIQDDISSSVCEGPGAITMTKILSIISPSLMQGQIHEPDVQEPWKSHLTLNDKGRLEKSINNYLLILENDAALSGKFRFNDFSKRVELDSGLPWRNETNLAKEFTDRDFSGLLYYIEKKYDLRHKDSAKMAIDLLCENYSYHPVRSYLDQISWDGVARLDTLLVDFLGAKDDQYTRIVTRKSLTAAVARIFEPGCKVDTILTLSGPQGLGKSTLLRKLALDWFSDSLTNMNNKEAMEQLQGKWILELAELTAVNNTKMTTVKNFITKVEDSYRAPYRDQVEVRKRQCVMFATTNERRFLKDPTGDRRFWPVHIGEHEARLNVFEDLDRATIDQIWAEAVTFYRNHEPLHLNPAMETEANKRRKAASVVSDRIDTIQDILNVPLPASWNRMSKAQQLDYYRQEHEPDEANTSPRTRVCTAEIRDIWGVVVQDMSPIDCSEIRGIMDRMPGWTELDKKARVANYGSVRCYDRMTESNTPS